MWIETVGATFFWFSLISMMALIAPILIVWISVSAFYPEKLISRYIVEPHNASGTGHALAQLNVVVTRKRCWCACSAEHQAAPGLE